MPKVQFYAHVIQNNSKIIFLYHHMSVWISLMFRFGGIIELYMPSATIFCVAVVSISFVNFFMVADIVLRITILFDGVRPI